MTILSVPDMSCNHCKATIEAALADVPQAGAITVDLGTRTVDASGAATADLLIDALDKAGYRATVAG